MPLTEEIFRLRYEAIGQGEVARARGELARLDGEVKRLKADFDAGRLTAQQYAASLDGVAKKASAAQAAIDGWQQPLARASGGIGQFANTLSMLSVLYDDIQYGSKNVANNLIAIGMAAPHPAMKILLSAGGMLVSVFHKQIDAAFGLGQAYKQAGDEAEAAAAKMETFGDRLAESLKADSGEVQRFGADLARTIDGLSAEDEGGLLAALLGTKGADQRVEDLKQRIAEAESFAKAAGIANRRDVKERIGEMYDEVQRARAERQAGVKAEVDRLIADTARGEEGARARLEDLARRAGLDGVIDALQRLSPEFAKAQAEADLFAIRTEKAAEANRKLVDQLNEAGKANEEYTKEVVRQADERVQAAQREAEAKARIREAEQNADADVNANAFRGALGGRIGAGMSSMMAGGASMGEAQQAAFVDTYNRMRAAGLADVAASNAAARLVEEQSAGLPQIVANVDAMRGLFRSQFRQGTVARRQASVQSQEIRRMQLQQNAMNVWNNNRPGWP